jgi:hypothetical protein
MPTWAPCDQNPRMRVTSTEWAAQGIAKEMTQLDATRVKKDPGELTRGRTATGDQ